MNRPILFITRNFPPLIGGMERLALESVLALSREQDVVVIGPRGSAQALPDNLCHEVTHGSAGRFLVSSMGACLGKAKALKPRLVIGGSGLAAPAVKLAGVLTGAPTGVFVHGLDLVVAHPLYRALCLPAIRACDHLIANSRNTAALAARVGVAAKRVSVLNPGVSLAGDQLDSDANDFPQAAGRSMLLFVGRMIRRKGLVEFVEHCLPEIVSTVPDVLLVVIGGDAPDALQRASSEYERLMGVLSAKELERNVLLLGEVDQQRLVSAYNNAAAVIFPVRDIPGDVEGFGMVALEAAAHGVPTVAFAAGGVPDAVAHGTSGLLISPDDYAAMSEAIKGLLTGNDRRCSAQECRRFAQGFSWEVYGEKLRGLVRSWDLQ